VSIEVSGIELANGTAASPADVILPDETLLLDTADRARFLVFAAPRVARATLRIRATPPPSASRKAARDMERTVLVEFAPRG